MGVVEMKREQLAVWITPEKKRAFKSYCDLQGLAMVDVIDALVDEVLVGKHEELIERVKRGKQ